MNILNNSVISRMSSLIHQLNKASDAYYNGNEILSNYEYDKLLDELTNLEKSSGITLEGSPNNNVGYPTKVDKINQVKHEFPALSLDKTKDVEAWIREFQLNGNASDLVLLMWKLDGCTVQLTYSNGKLQRAATRGNGYVGQDITHNAASIIGIPLNVPDKSRFTVRGEALISYEDFDAINGKLTEENKFKNPRNLASATISMLDSREVASRKVHFKMFELVDHPEKPDMNFHTRVVTFAEKNGFDHVPAEVCVATKCRTNVPYLGDVIKADKWNPENYEFPVDGLVCAYYNTTLTDSLEGTAHHPNPLKGYALKWADKPERTTLRKIEWSPSRTGALNPVAVFDPVEIDGTTVKRASLHNVSIMEKLHLHIGDQIDVIKANLVIPQIVNNASDSLAYDNETEELNVTCPVCGYPGMLRVSDAGIKMMFCPNPSCRAKLLDKLANFCSRDAMDIKGLSEQTLLKFVEAGFINSIDDIFNLVQYHDQIVEMPGFGQLSWNKLWDSIVNAKNNASVSKFVVGLGILGVGSTQSKAIAKAFNNNVSEFFECRNHKFDFTSIPGFGPSLDESINKWLASDDCIVAKRVAEKLTFVDRIQVGDLLSGKSFVITGKLKHYKNRKALEEVIEANGGSVLSSVSSKTSYLINNDINSTSSKNKKAKQLNIPIITEEDFMEMIV